ncbi:hypothetical protein ACB092_11G104400 [Castanea dentata]
MKSIAFHHLCHILTEGEHVRPTVHMSIMEQVLIFLHIIGHNVRFRVIGSQFHRLTETVHRNFNVVLMGVLKLYRVLIRLPSKDTPPKIRNSRRFYPYFKFSDRPSENEQELFNLRHSSLRTTIEKKYYQHYIVISSIIASISKVSMFHSVVHIYERGCMCVSFVMSKGKEKVGVTKQFRWLPRMHTTMLKILAEEAAKGNEPSNTFKADSFTLVANEISTQFGVECHPSYVENRMQTLRTMWTTIQTIRKKSGFGWDDNLKMITCDAKTYPEEVMAHCKHAEYLNKKIEMYDELSIVVGKDTATGSFSKSYVDIVNEPDNGDSTEFVANNVEEGVVDKVKNAVESSTTGSGISKSRKRGCTPSNTDDSVLIDLFDQLKEIVVALKEINQGSVDYTSLYNEVMAMMADGYSEDMLATAFDHLCENKKAARRFLAKNAKLGKLWMDSFLFTQI